MVRPPSDLRRNVRRTREGRGDVSFFQHNPVLCLLGTHLFEQSIAAGKHRLRVPRDLQLLSGAYRIPFALGDDANEVASPDKSSAWNAADGAFIHAHDFRPCSI